MSCTALKCIISMVFQDEGVSILAQMHPTWTSGILQLCFISVYEDDLLAREAYHIELIRIRPLSNMSGVQFPSLRAPCLAQLSGCLSREAMAKRRVNNCKPVQGNAQQASQQLPVQAPA